MKKLVWKKSKKRNYKYKDLIKKKYVKKSESEIKKELKKKGVKIPKTTKTLIKRAKENKVKLTNTKILKTKDIQNLVDKLEKNTQIFVEFKNKKETLYVSQLVIPNTEKDFTEQYKQDIIKNLIDSITVGTSKDKKHNKIISVKVRKL